MLFRAICLLIATLCIAPHSSRGESRCDRIVSLAPSITEVVYDLELGGNLVGATRFCRYPPEAQSVPRVGGFYDASPEQIVVQRPTHVFVLKESGQIVDTLRRLRIEVVELDHSTLNGIKESYQRIGEACHKDELATKRLAYFAQQEQALKDDIKRVRDADAPPLRTMVVVGRSREGSAVSGLYISGRDGFYSEVLRLLGATNVNDQSTVAIPAISAEGMMVLAPDVIVEVMNVDDVASDRDESAFWNRFASVPAVQKKKVFLVRDDFASIPGPRYIRLAQKLFQLFYTSDKGTP